MTLTYKNTVGPVIAGLVLVATATVSGVTLSGESAQLEQQQLQIESLRDQIEAATTDTAVAEQVAAATAVGGDAQRVAQDRNLIQGLAQDAFSWEDEQSYNDARAKVARVYGIPEDSRFLTTFFPPAPETRDADGNRYSYIDAAGLNSHVGEVRAHLLSVKGINYRYMVHVTVLSSSSDGKDAAGNIATLFLTIDGDGVMTGVTGFAATERPRSSG